MEETGRWCSSPSRQGGTRSISLKTDPRQIEPDLDPILSAKLVNSRTRHKTTVFACAPFRLDERQNKPKCRQNTGG